MELFCRLLGRESLLFSLRFALLGFGFIVYKQSFWDADFLCTDA